MNENGNTNRELKSECVRCSYPVFEEKRRFYDEMLAIAVCPNCHAYNWVVPLACRDGKDDDLFEESESWAYLEAPHILEEHGLLLQAGFSETAKIILGDNMEKITHQLLAICKLLDRWKVYVSQYESGITIRITR